MSVKLLMYYILISSISLFYSYQMFWGFYLQIGYIIFKFFYFISIIFLLGFGSGIGSQTGNTGFGSPATFGSSSQQGKG